eukprot:CAMPEP_0114522020 /NCGR_PEP_ID=MMETSP0109-20121206/20521_1 /TAXON_ID=29199 /ORGANISM="Chlorarachnion reptans, Strain CCCM449" /LENGTH=602 /DNA_ID=CAMNT_0001703213 /DNA_START=74 /DNA_END=1882 /DNA_ORIENTATION=-
MPVTASAPTAVVSPPASLPSASKPARKKKEKKERGPLQSAGNVNVSAGKPNVLKTDDASIAKKKAKKKRTKKRLKGKKPLDDNVNPESVEKRANEEGKHGQATAIEETTKGKSEAAPAERTAVAADEQQDDGKFHDLRVAMVGNVDSGKSTLIGVLTGGELDDGRGKARSKIFAHRHEAATGRTSCISQHIVGVRDDGKLVHSNKSANLTAAAKNKAWRDVVERSRNVITLVDLAGHERYLKTTIGGLTGCFPDYACLIIGANMGITKMTKEHLGVVLALNIPVCCVVTKIDICPPNVLQRTKRHLFRILKSRGAKKQPFLVKDDKDVKTCLKNQSTRITPVFLLSAVTGKGMGNLEAYLSGLRPRQTWDDEAKTVEFNIEETFNVTGVGVVVSGTATHGRLVANSTMLLGPFGNGNFKPVLAKTIQRKRVPVPVCNAGESCAVAIRSATRKETLRRSQIRRGMILVDPTSEPRATISFEADILVLHHPTTIKENYQAVVHCGIIRQTARMVRIQHKGNGECLRTGDKASVLFRFLVRPEFVHEGTTIIFREGTTKGVGKVTRVLHDSFKSIGEMTEEERKQNKENVKKQEERRIRVPKSDR